MIFHLFVFGFYAISLLCFVCDIVSVVIVFIFIIFLNALVFMLVFAAIRCVVLLW